MSADAAGVPAAPDQAAAAGARRTPAPPPAGRPQGASSGDTPASTLPEVSAAAWDDPEAPPWPMAKGWVAIGVLFSPPLWLELYRAVREGTGPVPVALACALILGYLACYLAGPVLVMRRPVAARAVLSGAALAVATVLVTVFGISPWNYSYALAVAAVVLPWGWAVILAAPAIATGVVLGLLSTGSPDWTLLFLLSVVLIVGPLRATWTANRALERANATMAELAIAADRERLARDLHDALGSTLTTLTVKAGLARRLLESGEPERAGQEVRDIEELGRQALNDVRATVAATHEPSLASALEDARGALAAAGIEARLPRPDTVPEHRVLAYVVREGVTNVIRHSRARRCEIRAGRGFVEILDDGVGRPRPAEDDTAGGTGRPGHGLKGLAARLEAAGGRLEAGPLPGGGYRLRAECPRGSR
ncbi:two-component system sensor histidine kinase DesK [Thermocatellispora tengchongensis]|uniref:Two-component system sensor histidine kinase DesK n=1 Tax=Thermocatellispora tengchongensis TaxID=1073253 RepID=A0A840PL36_9ACTN|nr:histidine kinase [Thermocatellispora tengchongensis]MBB5137777.1 two-component system sensor histidine kinase DesK [Thermocatellispora tengchongensis]